MPPGSEEDPVIKALNGGSGKTLDTWGRLGGYYFVIIPKEDRRETP